jgi:hypothetical protein
MQLSKGWGEGGVFRPKLAEANEHSELQPSAGRSFGLHGSLTLACQHTGQRADNQNYTRVPARYAEYQPRYRHAHNILLTY